jgi:hypothetical protein
MVVVFGVLTGAKRTAKISAIFQGTKAFGKIGSIFQGLELTFRERVLRGYMRPAMGSGHPQIRQQQGHGLGFRG